jgi:hypothetical protein
VHAYLCLIPLSEFIDIYEKETKRKERLEEKKIFINRFINMWREVAIANVTFEIKFVCV